MSLPRRPKGNGKPKLLAGRKRKKSASFLDEASVPYLLLDPSGTIVEANPPAARLLGREHTDLQRLPLREFVCEADRKRFDRHLDQCLGGGKNVSTELKLDVSGTPLVELISPSCVASQSRKMLLHMIIHERPTNGNGSPATGIEAKEIQKLNRTLRAMSESSQAMMRATEEASYMNDVCRIVQQDCGHAMVWIGLARDDEEKSILPAAHAGFEEGYLDTLRLTWDDTERGRGPTGTAVRTGQPVICRNMRTDPRFKPWREEAIRRGYAASIALPLASEEKTFGALTIYSREPDPFSADEVRLLSELAGDLSYGLTALRLRTAHEVAERSLRESETRYRALFDSMAEGFALHEIITDSKGQPCDYRFLEVNPSFERLTGLRRGELVGKRVLEILPDNEPIWIERYGKVALTGEPARFDSYSAPLGRWYEVFAYRPAPRQFAVTFADITERKRVEAEHREVEERVRRKLESVLNPEGDLGVLELGDIIDVPAFQKLMNDFYAVSHFPMSIVDMKGRVLVGVGWQDICTRFHRVNPETCKLCLESDTQLSAGVARGEFRQYRCKNNLWDIATPIVVAGRQVGNVFSGQFFFDDETVNREAFRAQARQYHFDEEQYLSALDRVPRLSRRTVEDGMAFLLKLSDMLSQLGYSNAQLARLLAERDRLTASLHEEEERLKRAQEVAQLGSWELDVASGTVTWSDEAYRILGREPQQTVATYASFLDHVHPDDRAAVDAAYTRSLQEGQDSYDIEHRLVNASTGEIRFVHERCHHTRDNSGNIVRSVGMVRDITEQKRAEIELRESRMKYQALIETTGDFIWEIDAQARYTYCSPQMERLWGLKPEEMIGKTPFDVMPAHLRDRAWETFRGYMTSPQAFSGLETAAYDSQGRLIHIETSGVPFFDKDGALGGFRGISRDVTERKHADEALRSSEERLHLALKAGRAGAWDWNMATGTSVISDSYRELFGIPPGQPFSYDSWLASLHPEDRERCRAYGEAFFGSKDSLEWDLEFRINTPHLGIRWHHATGTVQRDETGKPQRFMGVSTDITDRKRIEESEERLKALMNHNPSLVFLKDESGRYVYLNDAYEEQYVHTKDWFGKTDFDFWPKESAELFRANDIEVLKSGRTHQVLEDSTDLDGKRHCWLAYKFPFTDSKGNRYLGGIGLDAIDRVRAEEAVRDQQSRLTLAMEAGQLVSYEIDLTTGEVTGSPQLFKAFGLQPTPEVHHRTHWRSLVHEDDREGITASVERAAQTGNEHHYEYRFHHSDGTIHWHETHGMVIADEQGHRRRLVGFLRDITERKQAEKELKRSTERFALLSETAGALLISPNPQAVVEELCGKVMAHLDCDIFFNFLIDENAQCLRLNACGGIAAEDLDKVQRLDFGLAVCGRVARDKRRAIVKDIQRVPDERTELVRSFGVQAYCCHPLMAGDRVLGTLSFGSRRRPQFSDDEVELMRVVADQVSVALERIRVGKAQRESEERLQEALRVSRSFAFEWIPATDQVHRSLSCSALLGLTGKEAEEETGEEFFQRLDSADRERFIRMIGALTPRANRYETKYRLVRPDGGIAIFEESGHGTFDSEGRLSRVIGITTDVTARERAEEALQRSEERFRLAIEHSQLMAWQCDSQMRFVWVYNSHFGIPDDDVVGKTPAELGIGEGMKEFIAHGQEVLEKGTGMRRVVGQVFPDGREEYFDQQVEPLRDPRGVIIGLVGISLNVTDRVRAEQLVHRSEEGYRLMIEHSTEPMLLVDESGRIDCISGKGAGLLGFAQADLVGTCVDRFLDWSAKLDISMRVRDFFKYAPMPAKGVLRIRRSGGDWCWIDVQASVVNYGQKPEKYLLKFDMINTDISR